MIFLNDDFMGKKMKGQFLGFTITEWGGIIIAIGIAVFILIFILNGGIEMVSSPLKNIFGKG